MKIYKKIMNALAAVEKIVLVISTLLILASLVLIVLMETFVGLDMFVK